MKNDFSIIYQLNVKLFQNSVLQFVQSVYLSFSLSILSKARNLKKFLHFIQN